MASTHPLQLPPAPAITTTRDFNHWRNFFEQLGTTVWTWNLDTDQVKFTAAWLEDMGYEPDMLNLGRQWFDLVHPDDAAEVSNRTTALINGTAQSYECEFRLRRSDGIYVWVLSRAQLVEVGDGETNRCLIGLYTDTNATRLTERRWSDALEGSNVGVWDWNLETNDVYYSPEWKRMLAYVDMDLEPTLESWRKIVLPEDLLKSDEEIRRYLAGEIGEYRCECRVQCKDGSTKWVLDRGRIAEYDANGKPVRMVGTHDDITEIKIRESELQANVEKIDTITGLIPGGVYQYVRKHDGSTSVLYASDGTADIFGAPRAEILRNAEYLWANVHAEDLPNLVKAMERSSRTQSDLNEEYRILSPDGTLRWIHSVATCRTNEQGDTTFYGYLTDITERKEFDLAFQKSASAVIVANDDLEQFNYVAAHDLKEPLRAIRNLSEWIEEDLPEDVEDSVRHNLSRMRGRVDRMQRLIDDLAAYSRAGKRDVPTETVTVKAFIADVLSHIEPRSCEIVMGDVVDLTIVTAPVALETIITNLVNNAINHHDRRDSGRVLITAAHAGEQIIFGVEDDGPGIPVEHHERIFRMYQQLNPVASKGTGSTGIGLAIVKRMLSTALSSISLTSPISDRGTRFEFYWPIQWPH
jgi:PAS domain S-box-containing protein